MSYVQTVLRPDEKVLAIGHMHWVVYARGMVVTVFGLLLLLLFRVDSQFDIVLRIAEGIIVLVGVAFLVRAWFDKWTTEVAVTDKRVIHKTGFIRRKTAEMNMDKVESVVVDQTLPGRLLNYGSIVVRGTGSGIEGLHHIDRPLELRSTIVVR